MSLCIHADDFGISESVSNCIAECFSRGWVNETSLMVNMPYAENAIELARRKGFASKVGLHLNLTQGVPLTEDIKSFPRFCDSDGTFNRKFHHSAMSQIVISRAESVAVRREIDAQLNKFKSFVGLLDRVDSHHHVHTDWSVYRLLEPLALKYGFSQMRISATLHRVGTLKTLYKSFLNARIRRRFITRREFDGFNPNLVAVAVNGGDIEMMVHPMYAETGEILDTKTPFLKIVEAFNG